MLPPVIRPRNKPSQKWTLAIRCLIVLGSVNAVVACGGSAAHVSSSGECAKLTPAKYLSQARVAFIGIMMAGPAAQIGGRPVLMSPAKVRVSHYVKGNGPKVVRVVTGLVSRNVVNAEGIEPQAGQRWFIYSRSKAAPYETSICDGSSLLR